jgi:hypothetical protein
MTLNHQKWTCIPMNRSLENSYKILTLTRDNFDVQISIDYDGDGKADNLEIYATRESCSTGDPYCQN